MCVYFYSFDQELEESRVLRVHFSWTTLSREKRLGGLRLDGRSPDLLNNIIYIIYIYLLNNIMIFRFPSVSWIRM